MAIKNKDIYGKVKPREDLFTRKKSKSKPAIMIVVVLAVVALAVFGISQIPFGDILGGSSSSGGQVTGSEAQQSEQKPEAEIQKPADDESQGNAEANTPAVDMSTIPAYAGNAYVALEGNKPSFTEAELADTSYKTYATVDKLGRVGVAMAVCGPETLASGSEPGGMKVFPSGWMQNKYENVYGNYLYSVYNLLGWQLTGDQSGEQNAMTATQYFTSNTRMLFESKVAEYIRNTGNHVAYRVTPVFEGNNLLASGAKLEAYSLEDDGAGLHFNVFCYNVQPGITIDYATGANSLA